jgi:hypothetical protein
MIDLSTGEGTTVSENPEFDIVGSAISNEIFHIELLRSPAGRTVVAKRGYLEITAAFWQRECTIGPVRKVSTWVVDIGFGAPCLDVFRESCSRAAVTALMEGRDRGINAVICDGFKMVKVFKDRILLWRRKVFL